MNNRRLKVYRKPGCDNDTVPEMRISGAWLGKLGFSVGDHVELALDEKQIVIRPAVDGGIPNMVEEAPGTEIPE